MERRGTLCAPYRSGAMWGPCKVSFFLFFFHSPSCASLRVNLVLVSTALVQGCIQLTRKRRERNASLAQLTMRTMTMMVVAAAFYWVLQCLGWWQILYNPISYFQFNPKGKVLSHFTDVDIQAQKMWLVQGQSQNGNVQFQWLSLFTSLGAQANAHSLWNHLSMVSCLRA